MERVTVKGGTVMIGKYLVPKLIAKGADLKVTSVYGNELCSSKARHIKRDFFNFDNLQNICRGIDTLFWYIKEGYKAYERYNWIEVKN